MLANVRVIVDEIKAFQRGISSASSAGAPVQLGDSFWSDRTCAERCTCTSEGLQCQSQPCSFSQICRPAALQFSCRTIQRRTCNIVGDPHYYTFDNQVFHFQGTCTYVLSEQCGSALPYYRVEGKNEHRGSTRVSWVRLVKVFVYDEVIELVKGHRASGDNEPGCDVRCGGLDCSGCTDEQTELYSTTAHCGIIQSSSGPFAACHQQLPPQRFVESCVYDLCVGGGYQPFLCQAIEAYARQCQQNGVQVSWRRPGFCEIPCPANSHFESQGTGCPPTCVNPNSTDDCPLPARESCVCNAGYVLSAGVCVPHAECGCSFEGRYYSSGETVILGEDCGRRCSCSYGSMTCSSHACGPHESCSVEEGERGCRPNGYATCWIREGTQISIEMSMFIKHCSILFYVDSQLIKLPYSSASNRIQIYHSSLHSVTLRTSFGVTVQTVWPHFVQVTAPSVYAGSLGGLCGDYNGHPHDDFRTPNGFLVDSSQAFGDSWRDGSLSAHCVENLDDNTENNHNVSEYCGILTSQQGPFAPCWSTVDPQQQVHVCEQIIQGSADPASKVCEVLRDYALMCQQNGVVLEEWRNGVGQKSLEYSFNLILLYFSVFTELACPANSHYELCGDSCPSACPSLSFPFTCDTQCQEGCQCDDGFVLNGNQCVPPTSCGCYHQGRYRHGGEQFKDGEECQSLCTCDGTTGVVHCVPSSCGPQESCRVVEGVFGCHPKPHGTCYASGDPHYQTFDGKKFDFQGTCRYVLAKDCNGTGPSQFSVEAKNEPWNGQLVSVTAEVFVKVCGYEVRMSRNNRGMVEVSGIISKCLISAKLSIFPSADDITPQL
uniref:VWFD domain-containing protein n=1 Tax=Salarias fasciatus TaxID=181472 RepID=A0A672F631_SALFA